MTALERPDPGTVSHEHVAAAARRRVGQLTDDLLLRDAKIAEQQAYITVLEARLTEQEQAPTGSQQPTTPGSPTTSATGPTSAPGTRTG